MNENFSPPRFKPTWNEFAIHCAAEIERFAKCFDEQHQEISKLITEVNDLKTDIRELKVKAGIWGFVGAACGGMMLLFFKYGFG